jgi:hypothetical protein
MSRLDELRAVLDRAVAELPVAELAELVGVLAAAKARALARVLAPTAPAVATDDVVDVATLAAELGLAPSWLRAQARTGKLPHLRCGKYIKFKRAEVLAALEYRMGTPVQAKKTRKHKGLLPGCYHDSPSAAGVREGRDGSRTRTKAARTGSRAEPSAGLDQVTEPAADRVEVEDAS